MTDRYSDEHGGHTAWYNELWALAARCEQLDDFLRQAVEIATHCGPWSYVGLVVSRGGQWTVRAERGARPTGWREVVAEASADDRSVVGDTLASVPLAVERGEPWLLVVAGAIEPLLLEDLAEQLARAIEAVRRRRQVERRLAWQEKLLEIGVRWHRAEGIAELLSEIAQGAAELLQADRASIFLWDRASETLVGRPALGVPGGELRLPDNQGVVGHVVQTGRSVRVAAESPEAQLIDRQTDKRLKYRTRNLLCVPLESASGTRLGAFEILNKHHGDFDDDDEELLHHLAAQAAAALENVRDRQRLLSNTRQMADQAASEVELIGRSPAIAALRSTAERVASTELAVLILGENGTGKEVIARMIHYYSPRRDKPFVAVNCAAVPETLAESELFGHEKGAFTDAHQSRPGRFELAAEGTLFLDEIAELPTSCQAKLLRVLEERTLIRVGGSLPIRTDARIIAATNQDLVELVRQRRFREDLYFRLCVVTLDLPPLRERGDDIVLLAEHFLQQFAAQAGRRVPVLTAAARAKLKDHAWPGNVRELRNLMERLAYLSAKDEIDADDLAFILSPRNDPLWGVPQNLTLAEATDRFQKTYIEQAIRAADDNVSEAAKQLGLHRSNLYRKMRRLGMNPADD